MVCEVYAFLIGMYTYIDRVVRGEILLSMWYGIMCNLTKKITTMDLKTLKCISLSCLVTVSFPLPTQTNQI